MRSRTLLASRTKAEVMAQAVSRKLLLAPVMHVGELLDSPHFAARGYVERNGTPARRAVCAVRAQPVAAGRRLTEVRQHEGRCQAQRGIHRGAEPLAQASSAMRRSPVSKCWICSGWWRVPVQRGCSRTTARR